MVIGRKRFGDRDGSFANIDYVSRECGGTELHIVNIKIQDRESGIRKTGLDFYCVPRTKVTPARVKQPPPALSSSRNAFAT